MNKIAVIGSNGYVGSTLCKELMRDQSHTVVGVTRENYEEMKMQEYDIIINCAMPSGRFWAKNHPEEDFVETVKKTENLLKEWKYKKFIQISTVSARTQLDTIYGKNKAAAEALCNFGNNLIVRLGAIYSADTKKGALADMLAGKKVYVSGESKYSFIDLLFCARWIVENLDKSGIIELGGKNAVALNEVAKRLGKDIEFEGEIFNLEIESKEDLPEASEVLKFIDNLKQ